MPEAAEEFALDPRAEKPEPPHQAVPIDAAAIGVCPACAGPLYPWAQAPSADATDADTYTLDRCELCGLAIVREGELDPGELLANGERVPDGVELALPNRGSLQASMGAEEWA